MLNLSIRVMSIFQTSLCVKTIFNCFLQGRNCFCEVEENSIWIKYNQGVLCAVYLIDETHWRVKRCL